MIQFGRTSSDSGEQNWRRQLDEFVKVNQQELSALAWGLWLENGDSQGTIGIDLEPKPHFVYCPKDAIERLNSTLENKLQEILGLVDAHDPQKEVLMLGIGNDQLKLIQFEPQPAPPNCFEQVAKDVDTLLEQLEQRLSDQLKAI